MEKKDEKKNYLNIFIHYIQIVCKVGFWCAGSASEFLQLKRYRKKRELKFFCKWWGAQNLCSSFIRQNNCVQQFNLFNIFSCRFHFKFLTFTFGNTNTLLKESFIVRALFFWCSAVQPLLWLDEFFKLLFLQYQFIYFIYHLQCWVVDVPRFFDRWTHWTNQTIQNSDHLLGCKRNLYKSDNNYNFRQK